MPRRNIMRCLAATVLACGVACFALPTGVLAQDAAPPPAPAAAALNPAPPEPAVAMELYRTVDAWVRAWQVPIDPAGQRPLPAAAVTLRLEGTVVGRGVAISSDPAGGAGILMMAAKRAMDEARIHVPIRRDALFDETLRAVAATMTLSVELAGQPVPIAPTEYADALTMVAPGLDAVAVRFGDRIEARFPSWMLPMGLDPARALGSLVSTVSQDAALSLKRPADLRSEHGAVFYRLGVTQLAQTEPGGPPVFLHRGGRIVSMRELDTAGLRSWADAMARHLSPAMPPERWGGPIPGVLDPCTGKAEPEEADLRTAAVVAAALLRYSQSPAFDAAARQRAFAAAQYVLTGMCEKYDDGSPEVDPVAAALTGWAMDLYSPPGRGHPNSMLDHVEEISSAVLWGSHEVEKPGTDDQPAVWRFVPREYHESTWAGPGAGAIAFGMAASARELEDSAARPAARRIAESAVRKTFLSTPAAELVSQMPWLGWAELRLNPAGEVASAAAMRELRAMVWQHQLKSAGLPPESQDLAGGIVFDSAGPALPTWHAVRPLALIATMLGDPRLTEEPEVPGEIVRLLASLRFLRQLTASEVESHMYPTRRAIGGVRSSLFDQRMPPEATAMTLLTVIETIRSLEAIQQRQKAAAEPAK